MRLVQGIRAGVGGWLISASFVLDYAGVEIAKHNDVGVGLTMLLGALGWGFSEWRLY